MSLKEIQRAVEKLPSEQRIKLTAWIVSTYPVLQIGELMARAAKLVQNGEWQPTPPTSDNHPKGKVLDRALNTAKRLGLEK